MKNKETYLALGIITIAVIARFLPHIPNFVPITAIAIFAGRYFSVRWSYVIPISAMIISDFFLGFSQVTIFVYLGLLGAVLLGNYLKKNSTSQNILLTTLGASLIFFVISNFGVWVGGWYSFTLDGLIRCYVMAIPFFRNSVAGDLFYTAIMFGAYEIISRRVWFKSVKLT